MLVKSERWRERERERDKSESVTDLMYSELSMLQ
jgi:hypothetical protein